MKKELKLIVGLGNPGEKYATTRHNVGWIAIDQLREQYGFTQFLYQNKFAAELANGEIAGQQAILAKPQTFMNKSGRAVSNLVQFYKPDLQDLLVVHDEIDIAVHRMKLKFNGSAGGHNGIKDIIRQLGTDQFWRLKLGVGRPEHPAYSVSDYVLGQLPKDELSYWQQQQHEITTKIDERLRNSG